jgi:hypothetical protein
MPSSFPDFCTINSIFSSFLEIGHVQFIVVFLIYVIYVLRFTLKPSKYYFIQKKAYGNVYILLSSLFQSLGPLFSGMNVSLDSASSEYAVLLLQEDLHNQLYFLSSLVAFGYYFYSSAFTLYLTSTSTCRIRQDFVVKNINNIKYCRFM